MIKIIKKHKVVISIIGACAIIAGIICAVGIHSKPYTAVYNHCKYALVDGKTMGEIINCKCFSGCMVRFADAGMLPTTWDVDEAVAVCMQRCVKI